MSKHDGGGPAFPGPWHNPGDRNATAPDGSLVPPEGVAHMPGMSLRDWFAGQAMNGLIHDILIDQHWEDVLLKQGLKSSESPDYLAHLAYLAADAMLVKREAR